MNARFTPEELEELISETLDRKAVEGDGPPAHLRARIRSIPKRERAMSSALEAEPPLSKAVVAEAVTSDDNIQDDNSKHSVAIHEPGDGDAMPLPSLGQELPFEEGVGSSLHSFVRLFALVGLLIFIGIFTFEHLPSSKKIGKKKLISSLQRIFQKENPSLPSTKHQWLAKKYKQLRAPDWSKRQKALQKLEDSLVHDAPMFWTVVGALPRMRRDEQLSTLKMLRRSAEKRMKQAPKQAKGVVKVLRNLASSNTPGLHLQVLKTLSVYHRYSLPAIPMLLESLKGKDWRAGEEATHALVRLAPLKPKSVASLIPLLKSKDRAIQRRAAVVLSSIQLPESMLSNILGLLSSEQLQLKLAVIKSLEGTIPEHVALQRALLKALQQASRPQIKEQLLLALGKVHTLSAEQLHVMLALLGTNSQTMRFATVSTLASLQKRSSLVVPALERALNTSSLLQQEFVLHTIAKIGPPAKETLSRVLSLLKGKVPNVRSAACLALGSMRQGTPSVLKALKQVAKTDTDILVRSSALTALGFFRKEIKRVLPVLIDAFSSPDIRVRKAARHALIRASKKSNKHVVAALSRAIQEKRYHYNTKVPTNENAQRNLVRQNIAKTLEGLGSRAKAATPFLLRYLKDPDLGTRYRALIALGQLGGESEKVSRIALEFLKGEHESLRRASISALKYLKVKRLPFASILVAMHREPVERVKRYARRVLKEQIEDFQDVRQLALRALEESERLQFRWLAPIFMASEKNRSSALPIILQRFSTSGAHTQKRLLKALVRAKPLQTNTIRKWHQLCRLASSKVRLQWVRVLSSWKIPLSRDLLSELSSKDPSKAIRSAAKRAIRASQR